MKIHHKNMKQVSQDMQQWVQSNLAHFGVFECNYSYFDIKESTWMSLPTYYNWYCHYMEQGLDISVVSRIQRGSHYLESSDILYKNHNKFMKSIDKNTSYRYDIVVKVSQGYEILTVSANRLLLKKDISYMENSLRNISYQAHQVRKAKPHIMQELRFDNEIKALFVSKQEISTDYQYQKAKFDDVILTAKEQLYIEHLMRNRSHKEIAHRHDVSETGVRNVLRNIKRKLGHDSLSTQRMFELLDEKGALSICSQSFKNH